MHRRIAGLGLASLLLLTPFTVACDGEDRRDVREGVNDVEEGIDDADTDGKDD